MSASNLARLRTLAGNQDRRLTGLQAAVRNRDWLVMNWRTIGVRPKTLADAEMLVKGLRVAPIDLRAGGLDAA